MLRLLAAVLLVACAWGGGQERHFLSTIWGHFADDEEYFEGMLDASRERGFDAISFSVPWRRVEVERDEFDFRWLDRKFHRIRDKDYLVHLRLDVSIGQPQWLPDEWFAWERDIEGIHPARWGGRRVLSYANREAVEAVARFVEAVVSHLRNERGILFYSVHVSIPLETEYSHDRLLDFSPAALEDFRRWLALRYGSPEAFGKAWGKKTVSFDEVTWEDFPQADWYAYRTDALARFIRMMSETVKAADPGAEFAVQFGSVFDAGCLPRGTLDVFTLTRWADWVIVDDGFGFPHLFSMDFVRSLAPGVRYCNEIDGPWHPYISDERALLQGLQSFGRGAWAVLTANWNPQALREREKWTFFDKVAAAGRQPRVEPRADAAVFVSTRAAYLRGGSVDMHAVLGPTYYMLAESPGKPWAQPVDFVSDTLLRAHPGVLKRYVRGVFVPAFNDAVDDDVLALLAASPVPVYLEDGPTGSRDAFGRPRVVEGFQRYSLEDASSEVP